jgi:hypothetical protein
VGSKWIPTEGVDDRSAARPRGSGTALPVTKKNYGMRRGVEITEDVDYQRAVRPRRAGIDLPR